MTIKFLFFIKFFLGFFYVTPYKIDMIKTTGQRVYTSVLKSGRVISWIQYRMYMNEINKSA